MTEADRPAQLVVVGSSAGGIDALTRLIAGLPADFGAPIVLAQHLDPRTTSHLAQILTRGSPLPVRLLEGKERLAPGVIYVVPANRNVEIRDHAVEVTADTASGGPRPSIDRLLATAAHAYGENLIAVVLTGSGSDGAAGARSVKASGGTVIIQDPKTATFPSMPASLAPTTVDIVASLEAMGPLLSDLVSGTYINETSRDASLDAFLDQIKAESGIDFSSYKRPTILRRLERRMAATGAATLRDYTRVLSTRPEETQRLIGAFLIKVTEFFRDPEIFDIIRNRLLPAYIDAARREGRRELRIWSAGCATGEEAYSLAIAVAEVLGDELSDWTVRIFATDLDNDAIEFARRGVYPASTLVDVPPPIIERYFTRLDGSYLVRKLIRQLTVFGQHDLAQRAPFPRVDLILCRNVLIDFTPELQRRALQLFAFSLRDAGNLILGKAETVARLSNSFVLEDPRLKVYRRGGERVGVPVGTNVAVPPHLTTPVPRNRLEPSASPTPRRIASKGTEEREELLRRLPIGVIQIDRNYDVISINPAARALFAVRGAAIGRDLVHLARGIPSETLRSVIDEAFAGQHSSATLRIESPDPARLGAVVLKLDAYPMEPAGGVSDGDRAALLIEDVTAQGAEPEPADEDAVASTPDSLAIQAQRLIEANRTLVADNEELLDANVSLRSQNEELLVANEEAQAATEEVETLNEELQATNEELETLNEELQATVEELNTTNDEMRSRTFELQETSALLEHQRADADRDRSRLAAVFESSRDALAVVDEHGDPIVTSVEYRALQERGLRLVDEHGNATDLEELARRAADQGQMQLEMSVAASDGRRHWYEVTATPVRTQEPWLGALLVLRDVTERSLHRLQTEFVAVVAHELRTPLTALRGYLQLVNRQLVGRDDATSRYASLAMDQAERLQALIGELFDTARVEAGKLQFNYATVDLRTIASQSVEIATSLSNRHRIELTMDDEPLAVRGDVGRLQQVFLNLFANAITHATGSERIDVRVQRQDGMATAWVVDHGRGIPAAEMRTLFSRYRERSATRGEGLGLGLFISREIVTAHDGTIEVSATPGGGTTITVRIPLLSTEDSGRDGGRQRRGKRPRRQRTGSE